MAIKVSRKPVTKEFFLESDPDGDAMVEIRQATQGDVMKRAELNSRMSQVVSLRDNEGDEIRYEQSFNIHKQRRYEIMLTLTNASGFFDEKDNELFRTRTTNDGVRINMSTGELEKALDALPPDVFIEIHNKVLEVNPNWGQQTQGE